MFNSLKRFMIGRYGMDMLGKHLAIAGLILMILSNFFAGTILRPFSYVLLIYCICRILSKKHVMRLNENRKYFELLSKVKAYVKRDRKYYRYLKCPKCRKVTKVPKHKGKIAITCPHCRYEFIKKT